MPISYCVSAKKASVVVESVVGNFTGNDHVNLLVARGNRIEVKLVAPEGLKNLCEIPIYGQVLTMALVKGKRDTRHSLVVITEKWHMAILAHRDGKTITRAAGSIADQTGRAADNLFSLTIHRNGLIAIRAFEGSVKMIQWESGTDLRHFNVRFDYPNVSDFKFIDTGEDDVYRVAFIFDDDHGKHLQFSDLNMQEKEFHTHLRQASIAADSSFLIPVPSPISGVIVLGPNSVLYKSSEHDGDVVPYTCSLLDDTVFTCHSIVDRSGERFLLSDIDGRLMMMLLNVAEGSSGRSVKDIRIDYLGETSIADSVNYIDNGVVFIGSRLGDSQLIRLMNVPNGESYIVVLETYSNIGPIRDMIMVESDGQPQLVTCSGAEKDGSLRVIRNGIGIDELASVDLAGVVGIFPIRLNSTSDNYIIVSLAEDTHVLQITGEELEEVQILQIDTDIPTMFAATLFGPDNSGIVLQVTEKQVRLMSSDGRSQFWEPTNGEAISKVSANTVHGQVIVAARDFVYCLSCIVDEKGELEIRLLAEKQCHEEIACLDISNEGDNSTNPATFLVLTLWRTFSMEILQLPDLKTVCQTDLPSKIVPRSIVATCIEDVHYLLVAFGDGALVYYVFDIVTGTHGEPKKSSVGTRPPSLHRVRNKNRQHLFVCSDRPVIIFSSSKKLVFSNVNVKVVNTVCSLSSRAYRDCLVISDGSSMVFGTVDDIQKIHVRSIPMGESVLRVAYQKTTGTYGVCSSRTESKYERVFASKNAVATSQSKPKINTTRTDINDTSRPSFSSFMILDQNTFQVLHSHEFAQYETAVSVISGQLSNDSNTYYIVGTGLIYPDEIETKIGRLIVFEVDDVERTKLRLVQDLVVRGSPLAIRILNGKIIAAINSSVRMFEWTAEKELRLECSNFNNVCALDLKVLNEEVAVADVMRSVSLLSYRVMEGNFDEYAKDWNSEWMVTCEFITAESILGGEAHLNLFTVEIDKSRPITDDGRYVLESTGFWYIGELPKVMVKATLVAQPDDISIEYSQPIMFGTNQGTIGMVVQIDDKWKKFLVAIEKAIADSEKNSMHIEHSTYRTFVFDKRQEPPSGFVDGDLIESILDMDRSAAIEILGKVSDKGWDPSLPTDPIEILKVIEDLARMH
uniref:DNA damage-binding protein 1 n=1 Tax=Caenorhabditis tropicalis TaxID=1561998 RepID=A0A1I7T0L8_9PELO